MKETPVAESFLETATLQEKLKERDTHRRRRESKEKDRLKAMRRNEKKDKRQTSEKRKKMKYCDY